MGDTQATDAERAQPGLIEIGMDVSEQACAAVDSWSDVVLREATALPTVAAARRFALDEGWAGVGQGSSRLLLIEAVDASAETTEAVCEQIARDARRPEAATYEPPAVYRQLDADGTRPGGDSGSAILHVHVDVDPDHLEPFLRWYVDVHVPAVLEAPGMISARRFENVRSGPPAGQHRFCTVYAMQDASVIQRPETLAASDRGACPAELAPHRRAVNQVYRVIGED